MAEAYVETNLTNLSLAGNDYNLNKFANLITDLKKEVTSTFTQLHQLLDDKQALILSQIDVALQDATGSRTAHREQLKQLQEAKEHVEAKLIHNQLNTFLLDTVNSFKEQISQLEGKIPFVPLLKLQWRRDELVSAINGVCELKKVEIVSYLKRTEPVWSAVSRGSEINQIHQPFGLAICKMNGNIYIADYPMNRIQVFSQTGDYVSTIKAEGMIKPDCLLLDANYCYVSCYVMDGHLLQLKLSTSNKVASTCPGVQISGIDFDEQHNIYGCVLKKPQLYVFSSNLKKLKSIHLNINHFVEGKTFIHYIQILPAEMIILFFGADYHLQSFTRDGDLIRKIVTNEQVKVSAYFCVDSFNNYIISEYFAHQIKVFTPSGELIVAIGKKGEDSGDLYRPQGIAVDSTGRIIVCDCKRRKNILQCL